MSSRLTSSPSPRINKSKKSASGSGLQTQGPPAITSGASASPRSQACSGIPAKSSIFRILVYDNSYCSVKPTKSNSRTESRLSSAYSGIWCSRISASKSAQGAKTRSHQKRQMRCGNWFGTAGNVQIVRNVQSPLEIEHRKKKHQQRKLLCGG